MLRIGKVAGIVALLCALAQSQEQPNRASVRVSLEGKSWSVVVDLPDFEITQNGTKPGGRRYLVAVNEKSGVVFSVTLERVSTPPRLAECREFLDGRAQAAPSQWGAKDVKRSDASSMALLEYFVPENHGVPLKQGNLFACTVKEDVFVDLHLSKVEYKPEERKLFDAIAQTVRFEEGGEAGTLASGVRESESVERSPSDAKALVRLGEELVKEGKVDAAIEQFQAAARLEPSLALPHVRLGAVYSALEKWPDAVRELRESTHLEPDDPSTHTLLGYALVRSGEDGGALAEAEQELQTALRLLPSSKDFGWIRAGIYFELAQVYERSGSEPRAVQSYELGLKENAEDAQIWNNYAWLLATAKDASVRNPRRAIELATRAVQAPQGNKPGYLDTLAEAYYADGQFDLAVETEEKAQQLDPQNPAFAEQLKKFETARAAKKPN